MRRRCKQDPLPTKPQGKNGRTHRPTWCYAVSRAAVSSRHVFLIFLFAGEPFDCCSSCRCHRSMCITDSHCTDALNHRFPLAVYRAGLGCQSKYDCQDPETEEGFWDSGDECHQGMNVARHFTCRNREASPAHAVRMDSVSLLTKAYMFARCFAQNWLCGQTTRTSR